MSIQYVRACLAALASTAALASASAVSAQSSDVDVAFNIGVVSDYVFRGFSQTDQDPALQGGIDATFGDSGFYAGAWASSVDFGDETDAEVDIYGGWRTEASGYALDFGVIGYVYVDEPDGADYNLIEFKAAGSRAIGPAAIGAAVYYSPDFFGVDEQATYGEVSAAFTPAERWTVSGAVGHQWLDVNDDYTTWNAGVSFALTENLLVDARYFDTDVDGPLSDDRVVGAIKVLF